VIDEYKQSLSSDHHKRIVRIQTWADSAADSRDKWRKKNAYFHKLDQDYLRFLVSPGQRVLVLGCGVGEKLACVRPAVGVGVDLSSKKIEIATRRYPELIFSVGDMEDIDVIRKIGEYGPYDVIVLYDSLGFVSDIQTFLSGLQDLCNPETRLISVYYAYFWEPVLKFTEFFNFRMKTLDTTWLRMSDVEKFMKLGGFEPVKKEWRILLPIKLSGIGTIFNKYLATLPLLRKFCLRHYIVSRLAPIDDREQKSVSVVIPCRNEKGNIEEALVRMPTLGSSTEIIFVEGHSHDGTWEEIQRVQQSFKHLNIKAIRQAGEGKGDAVRAGFEIASGEILMILDADLTVPPEELPKFYEEIRSGRGEYINGSRLVYSMEDQAMRFLNFYANQFFAKLFTFLLNQDFTDTLCGTKVIGKENYRRLSQNRDYFGDFDPFGDFDLIFGATKLNLKILEVPVRYRRRRYGTTQISRFRHGFLLIKMVLFAYRKLKLV
jgi:SAM-dependent methyltransferase